MRKMLEKIRPIQIVLLLFAAIFIISYALLYSDQQKIRNDLASVSEDSKTALELVDASITRLYVCTLKEYDGRIGVFRYGESIPIDVLDVYVFTLPERDQTQLRRGIYVYSNDALRCLVEDFTG